MRSAASIQSTCAFFARKRSANAAATFASRESSYRGALALWCAANPDATYGERDAQARSLRRKFNV